MSVTLDIWVDVAGVIDGALEISPGSALRAGDARKVVASEMRRMLNGGLRASHSREVGGIVREGIPEDPLDQPACVMTMAWDENRRDAGFGFGPLGNDRKAPDSIRPLRDLIEWTLAATT